MAIQATARASYPEFAPDALGRRMWTVTWEDPEGVFRQELSNDGMPVGYRRGQVFSCSKDRLPELCRGMSLVFR